jgi:copper(I)-binding protein
VLTALAAPAFAAGSITVEQPWMRFIIKATPAAGYMTLKNAGDRPVALTSASSPACGMLMLHQSKQQNGIDSMTHVEKIAIPAHGSLQFSPGGYHLMCMQPKDAMKLGASVPVTLTFADGQSVTAQFPVKGPGGR